MPLPVISITQMREWERATWASGQTEAEVIRRVGSVLASLVIRLTRPEQLILILAGKGHNGDDARLSREYITGRRVAIFDVKDPREDLPKLESLFSSSPSLIVDGLFGIGLNRELDPDWIKFIDCINQSKLPILAVDVPSGLDADKGKPLGTAIRAAYTLTIGAPKSGLLNQSAVPFVGRLEVATDVGLIPLTAESDLQWTLPSDFADYPPRRLVATHKGTYGHLCITAGSVGFHGAAVLTSRGAQRAQPGLITLFTTEGAYSAIASQTQAVMASPWHDHFQLPPRCSALLYGPGLAGSDVTDPLRAAVKKAWKESPLPVVVDASALDWLEPGPVPPNSVRVLTPHPGEASRLVGTHESKSDRQVTLRLISKKFGGAWVVLKGHQTLVGDATGKLFVNPSGNPHLAQGGSGDLLSGYISGLLAQPLLAKDPLKTIRFAVWQHGAAADLLQRHKPNWIIEELANILGELPTSTLGF